MPPEAVVTAVRVQEGLSELFSADVEFICSDPDLDLKAMIWSEALVGIESQSTQRVFHGIIEEAEYLEEREQTFAYRLNLRPRIYGLSHRVRSRIFQTKKATEIIQAVLVGAGIPAKDLEMTGLQETYSPREYCTQWKESELAFILRLLEEEGIFFWFEHSENGHVLKLADKPTAHSPIEGDATLPLSPWGGRDEERECVMDLSFSSRLVPDACTIRDWDWRTPRSSPPQGNIKASPDAAFEQYLFPGGFVDAAIARRRARDHLIADRVRRFELRGSTNSLRFSPGRLFQLAETKPETLMREYLILSVRHRYGIRESSPGSSGQPEHIAEFVAIPSDVPFKPAKVTPKPCVHGKESALITGPRGEEIHVDEFGRVKVHFYWDREGALDDHASCWIRVQQQNTSGSMILPRVGWEVEVGFLYGDPDRPVVLQKLYNAERMPPYALPANLNQAALQTESTPGGGGTNEIRMNDGVGGMQFFIHSQKDLTITAGHNLSEEVAVNSSTQVTADCETHVDLTEDVSIGVNQSDSVTGSATQETVGAKTVQVGAMDEWGVGGMHAINTTGARTENIGGLQNVLAQKVMETFNQDHTRTVGGLSFNSLGPMVDTTGAGKTETVGGLKIEKVSKAKAENVTTAKVLTAGAVVLKAGKDLSVSAQRALAFTTGGPMAIKCGKDFSIAGKTVSIVVGSAEIIAGASLNLTPGSIKIKGDSIGGDSGEVKLSGTLKYR